MKDKPFPALMTKSAALLGGVLLTLSSCTTPPDLGKPLPNPIPIDLEPRAQGRDKDFIGLSMGQASSLAGSRGLKVRVVVKDGEHFPVTMDYRTDRVNFHIQRDRVIKATRG